MTASMRKVIRSGSTAILLAIIVIPFTSILGGAAIAQDYIEPRPPVVGGEIITPSPSPTVEDEVIVSPSPTVEGEVIVSPSPEVEGRVIERDPLVQPRVVEREPGLLPITGRDLTLFLLAGAAAVAIGAAIVRRTRRSRPR